MTDARKRRKGRPQPPKPGRGAVPSRGRSRGKGPLVAFGALLVLLLIGSMIFGGIGQADVPDGAVAVIEDTPEGTTVITREEFDRVLAQFAANEGIRRLPEEGTEEYKRLAGATMQAMIDTVWVEGEAAEQGVSVSDRDVDAELDDDILQPLDCSLDAPAEDCEPLQRRLRQFKLTLSDLEEQIRTGLLGQKLLRKVKRSAPGPTEEQVEDYYETFTSQFELPETRDVRLVLNSKRVRVLAAKRVLEADSSEESWEQVAREFSTDTSKSQGGLREGLSEGLIEEPLNTEIFDAEKGEIVGPVKTPLGFYVFELIRVQPARTQSLTEILEQLDAQLKQQSNAEAREQFVADYRSRWTARTVCAEGFLFDSCDNANGENDFAGRQELRQQERAEEGVAAALRGRTTWPKPPDTLTPPLGAVGSAGTQIICYLADPAEGQPDPLAGTAPAQGPHPPGEDESLAQPTPGQVPSTTCGAINPLGITGSLPGAGGP